MIGGAITALLSGLLVPYVTSSWQEHDRELERRAAIDHEELGVKSALVNRIGRATANFLGASQLHRYAEPTSAADLSEYDRAYVRWSISTAEIASQLAAYLPNSPAERKWRSFSQNMRNTYLLVRAHPGDERPHWLAHVHRYLQAPDTSAGSPHRPGDGVHIQALNGILHRPLDRNKRRNHTYEAALRRLLLEIQKKERSVVSLIVDTPSALQPS